MKKILLTLALLTAVANAGEWINVCTEDNECHQVYIYR